MGDRPNPGTRPDPASIDQALLRQRVALRFRLDAAGRLLGENLPEEPDDRNAPRLYACLGPDLLVYAFRHDVPAAQAEHATTALEALSDALFAEPGRLAEAGAAIAADWGAVDSVRSGPVFRVPRGLVADADVVVVDATNAGVLARSFPHTHRHLAVLEPCVAHVVGGDAVAVCRAVRRSRFALEAGVDTLEAHRGRGLGAAVVAAWADRAWQEGRVPCYSTDTANAASLALAARLGMIRVGTELTIG